VILTAEHDVLRREGELYGRQLVKARLPLHHERFAGQIHGFFTMVGMVPAPKWRGISWPPASSSNPRQTSLPHCRSAGRASGRHGPQ
jgi:acetyl esterase/lipase